MNAKAPRAARSKLLRSGDVLKTHPHPDYWGCALVLSVRDKTPDFEPMCHVAISPFVIQHDYGFAELRQQDFSILRFERYGRADAGVYVPLRTETCIGVYSRKMNLHVNVIGTFDPAAMLSSPLEFTAGNGSDGGWPFCGRIASTLGGEAVIAWRRVHDDARLQSEVNAARAQHEELLAAQLDDQRHRAKRTRTSKGTS
jgi:hypothetical protein